LKRRAERTCHEGKRKEKEKSTEKSLDDRSRRQKSQKEKKMLLKDTKNADGKRSRQDWFEGGEEGKPLSVIIERRA